MSSDNSSNTVAESAEEGQDQPAPPAPLSPLENCLNGLKEYLGEDFLGTRLDRGETSIWVKQSSWRKAAQWLREHGPYNVISDLMAVDYLERVPRFDLSLMITSLELKECIRLKTLVEESNPVADSLVPVWAGANWFEREIFDLFGIQFAGHPHLKRLLLPADYTGHPLRKDYPVTGPAVSVFR